MMLHTVLILAHAVSAATFQQIGDSLTLRYDVDGVTVIHRVVPASEVVAANLYFLGGARQVTERTAGIEPLLLRASEHGTAGYPGTAARKALARTGGWIFVEPESDWTVFGIRGLRESFDSAWAVFADRIMHPTLDSAGIEIERAKMIAYAKARWSDPDEKVRLLAERTALRNHPYRVDVEGTEASLGQVTTADLEAYHASQTVTSRMLLVIVGNVSAEHVRELVSGTLGRLPAGDYVWRLPPPWAGTQPSVTVDYQALPTKYVTGYFGGPLASSYDFAAFRVAVVALSSMIATGTGDKGLSYAGMAMLLDRAASGGAIYFSSDLPKDCLDVINESIDLLQNAEYSRPALREYARSSVIEYYLENETVDEQADGLGRTFLFRGVLPSAGDHVAQLMQVSPTDVKRAARDYFKSIQYVLLGDTTRVPRREMTRY